MEEDDDFSISLGSNDEYPSKPSTLDDVVENEYRFGPCNECDSQFR